MRTEPLRMGVIHQTPVPLGGESRAPLHRKAGKSVAEISDGWADGPGPPRDQASGTAGRRKSSPNAIPSPGFADPGEKLADSGKNLAGFGLETGGRGVQIGLTLARCGVPPPVWSQRHLPRGAAQPPLGRVRDLLGVGPRRTVG